MYNIQFLRHIVFFSCYFCEVGYVGMTSRQLGKRIKEHIPNSIDEFCKMSNNESKSIRVVNVV